MNSFSDFFKSWQVFALVIETASSELVSEIQCKARPRFFAWKRPKVTYSYYKSVKTRMLNHQK